MKKNIICFFVITFIALNFPSFAQISGAVFHDYNGDGIQNNIAATSTTVANIETGISSVTIKAFSSADVLIATQITGVNGTYSFPVGSGVNQIPNTTSVRLEYVLPENCVAASGFEFSALGGFAYGSNVQFKTQAPTAVTANFGINNFAEYRGNNNNPKVIVPRHSNGDPIASPAGNSALEVALYSFNYTASGQSTTGNDARTSIATAAQIGACWGVAYNKFNDRIYTSAFLKRHSGFGPGGPSGSPSPTNAPGAIYVANPNVTNSGSFFFSMDALGAAYYTHDHTIGAALNVRDNVTRGLNKDIDTPSGDADAFDQVGKVGIGDIELSDDARYMWLTNLYNKKLYRIDLTNALAPVAPTPATAATLITSWALPVLTCNNGVLRPFGIKYYKGKIYVGVVCTGETEANANSTTNVNTNMDGTTVTGGSFNLGNAYILQFNATGAGVWNTMLTIPLNYPRGNAADEDFAITRWYNWASNFNAVKADPTSVSGALIHPQPILSNIEFDVDGTMIIGFMDRLGNQAGLFQGDTNGNSDYFAETGGDILRAYNNGCNYQLETNGKEGASSPKPATAGTNRGQGPGSGAFSVGSGSASGNVNGVGYGTNYGEFYHNDRVWYGGGPYFAHNESSLGGLAFLYGSNEVMVTSMDPLEILTNGVNRYNNTNGDSVSRYEIITFAEAGTFGKANSLGDVEIISSPPPIEIGNRVWNDTNGNGIQDAGENGIGGVMLELYNHRSWKCNFIY
jgi:SdrD B-like domain